MDQFMEEQEKDAQAQVDALIAEHQDILQKMALTHDRKLNDLKLELEASEGKTQQQQVAWADQYEQLRNDYDLLSLAHQGTKNERDQLQQKVTDLMQTMARNSDSNGIASPENDNGNSNLHKKCQQKQAGLEQKLHSLEQQQQQQDNGNSTWIAIAQQHKNELELLYNQYQQLLDRKDHELEDYGSRVQTLTMEQRKALSSCRMELGDRITSLENQVDSYETTIHSNNETLAKLQTRLKSMEQQKQKDQQTIHALIEEKTVLENELDKWIRYANQQQDQAHDFPVD